MTKTFTLEGADLKALKPHEVCAVVPSSDGVSVRDGVLFPVVLIDRKWIVDGRARVRGAIASGLTCVCEEYEFDAHGHLLCFVAAAACPRLNKSQRAIVASRLITLAQTRDDWYVTHDRGFARESSHEAGRKPLLDAAGVTDTQYYRAARIHDARVQLAVFDGLISLDNGAELMKVAARAREKIIRQGRGQAQAIRAAIADEASRKQPASAQQLTFLELTSGTDQHTQRVHGLLSKLRDQCHDVDVWLRQTGETDDEK